MNKFQELLSTGEPILIDGAMGTELFARGLITGDPPDGWNVEFPDRVKDVHDAYIAAGSQIILTNSFGGTSFRLKLHNWQDRVYELNYAAAQVGRSAADAVDHTVVVAGSIGPSGELLVPMGEMTYEMAVEAFAAQAKGLADGGADILWVETMSDLDEVKAAVEGCKSVCDLPVCATLSFDTNGRSMMGVTAELAATTMGEWGLAAIGANCGNNLADTEAVIRKMHQTNPDLVLISKANAGMPKWVGDDLIYDGSPEIMGAYAHRVNQLGAQIIGGCCGSSPAHIKVMKQVLTGEIPVPDVTQEQESQEAEAKDRSGRRRRRRKA